MARTNHLLDEVLPRNQRPSSTLPELHSIATTTCHEEFDNLSTQFTHDTENGLAAFSHVYSLRPMVKDLTFAWSLIRDGLIAQHQWDIIDLPKVTIKIIKHKTRRSSHAIVQCKDARTHKKMKDDATLLEVIRRERGKSIKYTLRLQDSGPRLGPEVFVTEFDLINGDTDVHEPIPHIDACRIATRFARHCGAAETCNYPHVKNGILGLYRDQMQECLSDGRQIHSDLDSWTLALSLPSHVNRSNINAYHTDPTTGKKYKFVFVGSIKYCKECANNSSHELEDCPNKDRKKTTRNFHCKTEDV